MESPSGEYEDYVAWTGVTPVFKDCEPDNEQDENVLVTFIKEHHDPPTVGAAKKVAELVGAPFEDVFPSHAEAAAAAAAAKKVAAAAVTKKAKPPAVMEEIPKSLADCNDVTQYRAMGDGDTFYFLENRKYSKARCLSCSKWFATPANRKAPNRKVDLALPSATNVVYVCSNMYTDKCSCGNFLCNACYNCKHSRRGRRSSTS